jgi:hypothetical protein
MKITICGSTKFVKEMREFKEKLESLGHEVILPLSAKMNQDKEFWNKMKLDDSSKFLNTKRERMLGHFDEVKLSDAILVLNYDNDGKKNYVGGNTFLEMAIALEHGKKIFLLNPAPKDSSYIEEIESMHPIILNGDLSKIS